MPERDANTLVAAEWIAKAENDLKNAAHTLRLGADCPTDTVCFHAQQCVEKYVKALLVTAGIAFARTHDIETLVGLMPKHARVSLTIEEQRRLTDYATTLRYPGPYEPVTLSEARDAVKLARRIRREIRRLLQDKPLF